MAQGDALVHWDEISHLSPVLWTGVILGESEQGGVGSAMRKAAGSTQPRENKLEISSKGVFNLKIMC